ISNPTTFFNLLLFFFQAEDGIRYRNVTGVQTCALPISMGQIAIGSGGLLGKGLGNSVQKQLYLPEPQNDFIFAIWCEEMGLIGRSEERRVGKECRFLCPVN